MPEPEELSARLLTSQSELSRDEYEATHIRAFVPALIPGPLQTRTYAHATLRACGVSDPATLDEAVDLRMRRAAHLRNNPDHEHRYIITNHALESVLITPADMSEQLAALRSCVRDLSHLRVRVLPTPSPVPWTMGYAIMTNPDGGVTLNVETPDGRLLAPQEMVSVHRHHFELLFSAATELDT